MPVIPAWLVRSNLNDPRRIPYLLVWKDERDGEIKEAVRLARYVGTLDDSVELKRTDESTTVLRIVWRMLPRNGERALFLLCPHCDKPRRHAYGREWDSFSGLSNRVRSISWRCRSCARLRYSSEGGLGNLASCLPLTETCHALTRGFPTCLPLWMPQRTSSPRVREHHYK